MALTAISRRGLAAGAIVIFSALYLADLTGMGMVGPDEPRYAAIGQAMARTGDWVTPRLWGAPWFEKPALLYWMTAAAFRAGLGPDLAPRVPVALLSLAFLTFFWWRLRHEWDARVAWLSTGMLATSAGWLAYSHVAITDLPLAAFFSAAVLLALPWIASQSRRPLIPAALCLGLAVLAKGLVPLVLFLPVLVLGWRRAGDWFRPGPLISFAVVTLPWYVACTAVNGREFLRVFFVQHQFERFGSAALQHVQPWWYYIPVALVLLFPWFPMLAVSGRAGSGKSGPGDPRVRLLVSVAAFGFVFFSASVNKLPSYLLPLVPCVCILMELGLSRTAGAKASVVLAIALLGLLPVMPAVVPTALARGLRSADISWRAVLPGVAVAALIGAAVVFFARRHATEVAIALASLAFLWLQFRIFPAIDVEASARQVWRVSLPDCSPDLPRSLIYGLYYYSGRQLPKCVVDPAGTRVVR